VDWWSVVDVVEVAAGVVAGGIINWLFSRRASKELQSEAAALRIVSEMLLIGLADAGLIKVRRDPETGKVFAVVVKGTTIRDSTEHPLDMEMTRKLQRGELRPGPTQNIEEREATERRSWWRRLIGM
jgi:hypothetical protein